MSDDRNIMKARHHLTVIALGLTAKLGPRDAAAVLLGAATGILTTAFGPEMAANYFSGVADAIQNGEDEAGEAGHA
jgi:hypothetical protein